jgi:hypothetical protein
MPAVAIDLLFSKFHFLAISHRLSAISSELTAES